MNTGGKDGGSKRHPLPASDEADHDRIPEQIEREKGRGEDDPAPIQPAQKPVNPDGESYGLDSPDR